MTKKIVVFTGAGISAESGIKTFRDSNGLWEEYNINEVATPQAWEKNPKLVLEFYNKRRKQIAEAKPNEAHKALVRLEEKFNTTIITQNIDDLHERAGSKNVIHLHGEITKARSTKDNTLIYPLNSWQLNWGDKCKLGSQLRPHIVWFGEMVPKMEEAYLIAEKADIFIVIGTSLNVYPAAGLVDYAPEYSEIYLIDPNAEDLPKSKNMHAIKGKASVEVNKLVSTLLEK